VNEILSYFVYPKGDVKICKLCEGFGTICKLCEGFGTIFVWRSDLEDYDEVLCPECSEEEN
jgi:hypothetical protein